MDSEIIRSQSSNAFTQLSQDDHDELHDHLSKILTLMRQNTVAETPKPTSTLKQPKLMQLEVPASTKELVIFAVSEDGQCQVVTAEEPPYGSLRIFCDSPTEVEANALLTLRPSETCVTRRANTIRSMAANDKDYANILSSLDSRVEIFTEASPDQFDRKVNETEKNASDVSEDDSIDDADTIELDEEMDGIREIENQNMDAEQEEEEGKEETEKNDTEEEINFEEHCIRDDLGLVCKICHKRFDNFELFTTHYKMHLPNKCEGCNVGFLSEAELQKHQKDTRHGFHTCEICKIQFTRKTSLWIHKKTQHKYEYHCDICNRAFVSARSFSIHKKMHINTPELLGKGPCKILRYYKCMGCSERFSDIECMQNHQCVKESQNETSNNEKEQFLFKRKRKAKFSYATSVAKRLKYKPELKTGITCHRCQRDFITLRALKRHELHHIDFRCKKCGAIMSTQEEFTEHGKKPCECRCQHCGKLFKKYRELQRHEVIHQEFRPFECAVCDGKFPTEGKLRAHAQIHEEKKNLCHLCSRTFTFRQHLTRHLKAHARGEPRRVNKTYLYHCSICSCSFPAVANLREHYDTKHRLPSFRCVNCQLRVLTYGELQNHYRDQHKGILINCCRLCGDAFTEKKECQQHLIEHEAQVCASINNEGLGETTSSDEINNGEKQISYLFSCVDCKQMFATHSGLITHNQIHYLEPPFNCLMCNVELTSSQELDEHIPAHENAVQLDSCPKCNLYVANLKLHERQHSGNYQCRECGKCLKTKQGLTVHSFLHTGEKPFLCSDCGMQFNNSGKLISHRRIHGRTPHTTVKQTSYTCSVCKQKFWRPSAFMLHLYSYHKEPCSVLRHVCTYCQREFVKKSNLTNHLRMHNEEKGLMKKEFSCNKCNRTFSTKAHQIIHTQMHDSEELVCPICSKQFTSLVCLQVHMRTHTGECKSCSICNKQFAALKYLKKHMLSHTGERYRVNCIFCDVTFTSQRACIRHLKDVHSDITPRICEGCGYGFVSCKDLEDHLPICKINAESVQNPGEIALEVVSGLERPIAELDAGAILETSDAVIQICAAEEQVINSISVPETIGETVEVPELGNERTLIMDLPANVEGANVTIPATSFVCAVDENLFYQVVFE